MRSVHTRHFDSPYLVQELADPDSTGGIGDRDRFLFPTETNKETIIATLKKYSKFRDFKRGETRQMLIDALSNTRFKQQRAKYNKVLELSLDPIEVHV